MNIQLDTSRANLEALSAAQNAAAAPVQAEQVSASVLSSTSLRVSERSMDLDKLTALLINDSEYARQNSILGVLSHASDIVSKINADAAAADRKTLTRIESVSVQKDEVEKRIDEWSKKLDDAVAHTAQTKTAYDDASAALDDFMKEYDAGNSDHVAKKAELETAKNDAYNAWQQASESEAALRTELTDLRGRLDELRSELDGLFEKLSDESHRVLVEAMKLGLDDFHHMLDPLAPEEDSPPGPKPISEMTLSELVQFVEKQRDEMRDDIENRRETGV